MAGSFFIGTKIHRDNSEQTRAQIFMGLAHGVYLSLLCPKDVLLWPRTIHCMNSSGLMRTGGYLSGERKRPRHIHTKKEKSQTVVFIQTFFYAFYQGPSLPDNSAWAPHGRADQSPWHPFSASLFFKSPTIAC